MQQPMTSVEPIPAPLITSSYSLSVLPNLSDLLGVAVEFRWIVPDSVSYGGVVAWGYQPAASFASAFAKRRQSGLLRLEDGFLRSVDRREPPLSIVVDDLGMYYDATRASRLEALIAGACSKAQQSRAQALMEAWRTARVSKYNHAREYAAELPARYVLVVDEARGCHSIQYGLADKAGFQAMLDAALQENPACTILIKAHSEGRRRGHYDPDALAANPRVRVLADDLHPVSLIEHAETVYCVTSQLGFEGLLWGKRVRTFGMPFYAGWGLTHDELPAPDRRLPVPLENLVYAALVDYPRYIDPETKKRCEPERLIEWLGLQRRMRERFPGTVYAQGFSTYKKPIVRRFFQGSTVVFDRHPARMPEDATRVVWSRKDLGPMPDNGILEGKNPQIVRLEDGFIRSVGLGADLVRPLSWAMDTRGIYYDSTAPSDLEHILLYTGFDDDLIHRAQLLRVCLVTEALTKYNVGTASWRRPDSASLAESDKSTPVILVPGQVESDASLAYGAPGIRRNLDLLKAVREANSQAYIVYKPHPDVVAGLRNKGQGEDEATRWCDEIVVDVAMGKMLAEVDEVHVLTSLTGFEALLRGKKVVCYGLPFYAGWGLTEDVLGLTRRTRRLTLNELVAGVLILYPTYISRTTDRYTTPERALDELLTWRDSNASTLPWWRKGLRRLLKMEMRFKQGIAWFFAK